MTNSIQLSRVADILTPPLSMEDEEAVRGFTEEELEETKRFLKENHAQLIQLDDYSGYMRIGGHLSRELDRIRQERDRIRQEREWEETPQELKEAAARLNELGIKASLEDKKLYLKDTGPSWHTRALVRIDDPMAAEYTVRKLTGVDLPDTITAYSESTEYRIYSCKSPISTRVLGPGIEVVSHYQLPLDAVDFAELAELPQSLDRATPVPLHEGPFDRGKLVRLDPATVDVADAAPEFLFDNLLYEGRIHTFYGRPGSGKSYAAQEIAVSLLKRGLTVVYIDQEKGGEDTIARMVGMGMTPDDAKHLMLYSSPKLDMDDAKMFRQHMAYLKPALVIWDNLSTVLAAAGIDENQNGPVTTWYDEFAKPLRTLGIATQIIDHTGKDGTQRAAIAKFAETDIRHRVSQGKPLNRNKEGQILLNCDKDAPGMMPKKQFTYDAGGPDSIFRLGATGNRQKILGAHEDGMTRAELIEAADVNEKTGYRIIGELVEEDQIEDRNGELYRP